MIVSLNYNFSLDQNYQDFNNNEIGTNFTNDQVKFNINYLEEKDHIGNQEYFKSNIEIGKGRQRYFFCRYKKKSNYQFSGIL